MLDSAWVREQLRRSAEYRAMHQRLPGVTGLAPGQRRELEDIRTDLLKSVSAPNTEELLAARDRFYAGQLERQSR